MQSEERIVSVSRDEAAEADQARESSTAKSVRLTARDAKLLGHLAVARYLSSRQIAQLVFPGCVDRVVRRRLNLLATPAGAVAHIAPLKYRSYNGTPMVAWKLTESGYARAEQALGRELKIPVKDVGHQFLEHTISLNDLYVSLATSGRESRAGAQLDAAPARQPFRWINSESARLPWAQYQRDRSEMQSRRIEPDAILEGAHASRRWFLECEMGGHSLSNPNENSGSTLSKIRRYSEFYSGYAEGAGRVTFYLKNYSDGWPGELAFLVRTPGRRAGVLQTIEAWRKEEGQLGAMKSSSILQVRALTFEEAPVVFRGLLGGGEISTAAAGAASATPKEATAVLSGEEATRLMKFTARLYDRFKELRAEAREHDRPIPAYPSEDERTFVVELLARKGIRRSA
jgi:hypothetical protein